MEFIVVRFRDSRDVFVDGLQMGKTEEILRVDPGKHTIDLGDPRDYTPNGCTPDVRGTTSLSPLEVPFDPA